MAKKQENKQNILTSFKPQDYSGFAQSTLALEKAKAAAQDPTAGFAALANPILQELGRQVQVSEEAKNTFLENMPDDFQVELVSPELKGELTNQLNTYKSEYLEGVELLSKYANNPNSEEYRRGVEIAEGAKNKMMNTYNGLVKFQQDRTYEINNANTRGWNDPANNIIANKLVVGLSADQVSYDDQGNPIYNAGVGEPINVFDYKRTRARDLELSNALFKTIEIDAYKAGSGNMNKDLFNRTIDHKLADIKMNPESADELFYIGVDGDTIGQTAPKNYIQDWDGLPPSKSPETMRKMVEHLKSTADLRYNDGLIDANKPTGESLKDEETFVNNINAGVPAVLSDITGDEEDRYVVIVPDEKNKGKYKMVSRTKGADLEGFKSMSLEELSKFTKIPLPALTGVQENKNDILNPF